MNKITIGYTDLEVWESPHNEVPYYFYGLKTGYLPDGRIDDYNDAYYTPDKKGDPNGIFDVIWDLSGLPDNLYIYPLVSEFYNCEFVRLIPGGVQLRYKLEDPSLPEVEFKVELVNESDFNECIMAISIKYLRMHPVFE